MTLRLNHLLPVISMEAERPRVEKQEVLAGCCATRTRVLSGLTGPFSLWPGVRLPWPLVWPRVQPHAAAAGRF